jgi:hypothetical protein
MTLIINSNVELLSNLGDQEAEVSPERLTFLSTWIWRVGYTLYGLEIIIVKSKRTQFQNVAAILGFILKTENEMDTLKTQQIRSW